MNETQRCHRLRSLSVVGGFLDGLSIEFAEGLNCLIGARGTGKTTVLEFVRYALNALPSQEASNTARRRIDSLIRQNLGNGGRVELDVELPEGLRYRISRATGEEPIVLTDDGEATGIQLGAGSFFQADIYSQNEVEAIADRSLSQLDLIDSFQSDKVAEVNKQIQSICDELAANANQIAPLQGRIQTLDASLSTLGDVEDKLKRLPAPEGQDGEAFEQAQQQKALRDREQRVLRNASGIFGQYGRSLDELQGRVASETRSLFTEGVGTGPNGELLEKVRQTLEECGQKVDAALETAKQEVAKAATALADTGEQLRVKHDEQEIAYNKFIEKHKATQQQAGERAKLEKRRNELNGQQRERQGASGELGELLRRREELLQALSDLRDERFRIRQEVAEHITASLNEAVRVRVVQSGNREAYQAQLQEALRNSGVHQNVVADRIARHLTPSRLVEMVRREDAEGLIEESGLNANQANKVLAALSEADALFDLEAVELSDAPSIELKVGEDYKPSSALSTGQKCTTILPILLLDSTNPLLVDQPEDNLDNRFIFECVVNSVRDVKHRRQLIFVTHNPNIPVLGDAEQVLVLNSDGEAGELAEQGNVDECRDHIVTLLEGGEEAFRQRRTRYAC